MSLSDPIGDLLTRIRNGQMAKLSEILCPSSKKLKNLLDVFVREGYIRGYTEVEQPNKQAMLHIELKYSDGEPTIREITRVSKPGRRVYVGIKHFARVFNGLGISVLSTPHGVLSDNEARAQNVGGEVLCRLF